MKLYLLALGLCIPTTSFSMHHVAKAYNRATGCYNKQLLKAAEANDKNGVLSALKHGADVNYQRPLPRKRSNFRKRSRSSYAQLVKVDNEPGTALHYCAKNGNAEIASILLDHGAQTTSENCKKHIPLYVAAQFFKSDVFKLLLEKTPDGPTKSMQCKMANNLTISYTSISDLTPHRDAIVNSTQEYLTTRMATLIERTLKPLAPFTDLPRDIKKIIIAFALTKKLDHDLYWAVYCGNIKDAEAALKAGANVNITFRELHYSILLRQIDPTKFLKITHRPAAFNPAVSKNKIELARLLLDYCIDITPEDLRRDFSGTPRINIEPFIQLIEEYKAKRTESSVIIEEVE